MHHALGPVSILGCSRGQRPTCLSVPFSLLSAALGLAVFDGSLPPPRLLQQENEELRRRLASATRRTEALERELEIGQDCLELELGQSREELDKFKDKFRRCGTRGQMSPIRGSTSLSIAEEPWVPLTLFSNPDLGRRGSS